MLNIALIPKTLYMGVEILITFLFQEAKSQKEEGE